MAVALIGNLMICNEIATISPTTSTGISNVSNQILPGLVTATASLVSGNYTYQWNQSGTAITFTNATSSSTNCSYPSLTVSGSTTIYCTVTDIWTGIQVLTGNCVITWNVQTVTQNVVISGTVTYNGSAQSYTLTGTPASPAPSGTPASFTAAGTYVYPTNITSITAGSGYTLGSVSGSFTINPASITAMSFTLNGVAFTSNQTGTAGTTYTIAVSSVTPAGASYSPSSVAYSTAGAYSLSSSGTGNYTGTFTSPTLTIINAAVSASISQNSPRTTRQVPCSAILTGATATGYAWAFVSGSTGVSFSAASSANTNVNGPASGSSTVKCTISYSGGTQVPTTLIAWGIA
uniref:Ig-like domain-containing protein n=1 Tax=viral metagenome TaxID=1070528 RepID=A0A6C0KX22_9ZZZZ